MTTALLCPGPSLPRSWEAAKREDYGEVVAVNTAGHAYRCDWLAFADWHIINPIQQGRIARPAVGCLCKPGMAIVEGLRYADLVKCFDVLGKEAVGLQDPAPRCNFTFPNALAWLQHRTSYGPIAIFGFDCAPVKADFSGQLGDHSINRWVKELAWVKAAWGRNLVVVSALPEPVFAWLNSESTSLRELRTILENLQPKA